MIYQKEMEVSTMTIDSTFWVAISFFIFFGVLIYFKVPQKINEILKNLYNSKFFDNVSVSINNNNLLINVKELPIIENISFEGIKAKKVKKVPSQINNVEKIQENVTENEIKNTKLKILNYHLK